MSWALASGCAHRYPLGGGVTGVRTPQALVWLVRTPHGVALVDTGLEPGAEAVLAALAEQHLSAGDVHTVLLTHGHIDHAGAAAAFPRARVYVGAGDVGLLNGQRQPTAWLARTLTAFIPLPAPPVQLVALDHDQVLDVDGLPVQVVLTPGHTAGSAMYVARGVLFSGDTLLTSGPQRVLPASPLYSDDPEARRATLERLRTVEFTRVADGHFGSLERGPQRLRELLGE